ncbi:hypothetical protein LDJ79_18330 [Vibrio tritonius]|uniref:Uncharacterized protein n=1 Tax=Vibrio tritonius TaxID=1435069 RepID=A0ABS7YQY3_9VIBR|nr:hypothetical protein [Vibrio tritonius]MCA2018083.1 hypothetical protein [Vibrio tritonius]
MKTGNGKFYAWGLGLGTLVGWSMGNMALGLIFGTLLGLGVDQIKSINIH